MITSVFSTMSVCLFLLSIILIVSTLNSSMVFGALAESCANVSRVMFFFELPVLMEILNLNEIHFQYDLNLENEQFLSFEEGICPSKKMLLFHFPFF